jgi:predicted nucleic acid-binding protein
LCHLPGISCLPQVLAGPIGKARSKKRDRNDEFANSCAKLQRDRTQARGAHDLIIAAHAAETGRLIVSRDARARFNDLPGVTAIDV